MGSLEDDSDDEQNYDHYDSNNEDDYDNGATHDENASRSDDKSPDGDDLYLDIYLIASTNHSIRVTRFIPWIIAVIS